MNVQPAVELSNVGKQYRIYPSPKERLLEWVLPGSRHTVFHALQDVSFKIQPGDTLGLVGDNGAGKSTLLKLIAGVLKPTEGQLTVNGSRLAILDLSVGLNEELSGRDNVLQQLSLYGLSHQQAVQHVDGIIEFAELQEVMYRPMKTYSSGMKVRLGFSILTSQSPDLLLIDEALSVGDLAFQQKSIRRMMDFKEQGKTIIFCSHSLYQIEQFCDHALWMQGGQVAMYGPSHKVLQAYEQYQLNKARQPLAKATEEGATPLRISGLNVMPLPPVEQGQPLTFHAAIDSVDVAMRYHYSLSIRINGERGLIVVGSHLAGEVPLIGSGDLTIELPRHPIASGHYTFHLRLWDEQGLVVLAESALADIQFVKTDRLLGLIRTPHHRHWRARAVA